MNRQTVSGWSLFLSMALISRGAAAADIPEPPTPADFRLITWPEVIDYCKRLDDASDRVLVRELGRTTEGRPYVVAIVSAAETIRDLDHFQDLQRRLALPAEDDDGRQVAEASKIVV